MFVPWVHCLFHEAHMKAVMHFLSAQCELFVFLCEFFWAIATFVVNLWLFSKFSLEGPQFIAKL